MDLKECHTYTHTCHFKKIFFRLNCSFNPL